MPSLDPSLRGSVDLNRATSLSPEVTEAVDDMFQHHAWSDEKEGRGDEIRKILAAAVKRIIANVPPCPDRSHAIRLIRDARMWANSAITHEGRY